MCFYDAAEIKNLIYLVVEDFFSDVENNIHCAFPTKEAAEAYRNAMVKNEDTGWLEIVECELKL